MTVNDMSDNDVVNLFSNRQGLYKTLSEDKKGQASLFVRVFKIFHKISIDWYIVQSDPNSVCYGVIGTGAIAQERYGRLFARDDNIVIKVGSSKSRTPFSKYLLSLIHKGNGNDNIKEITTNGVLLTEKIVACIEEGFNNPTNYAELGFVVGESKYPNTNHDIGTNNLSSQNSPKAAPNIKQASTTEPVVEIYYGPPGTGKTRKLITMVNEFYDERARFVTFHQSYGYEEFVEGIKPVMLEASREDTDEKSIRYRVENGVFKQLCEDATNDTGNQYALVIDEINRGNISKIFGELITLIEPSKRFGGAEYVSVTLPYSGRPFSVPTNLDIYGSMNTADRSLALLDTALRRRFNFVAFYPDASTLEKIRVRDDNGDTGINLAAMLEKINQRIEALYDRDHTIGHGYFLAECQGDTLQFSNLQKIFKEKIIPLLEEYFFEDNSKIALVLGDGTKMKASKLRFYNEKSSDFGKLFGTQIESSANDLKTTYTLNTDALSNVSSYIGIYQSATSTATT